jgi:hypothetical protein
LGFGVDANMQNGVVFSTTSSSMQKNIRKEKRLKIHRTFKAIARIAGSKKIEWHYYGNIR